MTVLLGAIADDFTGATDLANTLVKQGMRAIQLIGVPESPIDLGDAEAIVVALKSRTVPPGEAVAASLAALDWLREQGVEQVLFKYCSTFDSTAEGNIGPVADALLNALDTDFALVCPAFPANKRTIYQGHLFVGDRLLSESSMKDHPLTPMRTVGPCEVDGRAIRMDRRADPICDRFGRQCRGVGGDRNPAGRGRVLRGHRCPARQRPADDRRGRRPAPAHHRRIGHRPWPAGEFPPARPARRPEAAAAPGRRWPRPGAVRQLFGRDPGTGRTCQGSMAASAIGSGPHRRRSFEAHAVADWVLEQPEETPALVYTTADPEEVAAVQGRLGRERAAGLLEDAFGRIAGKAVDGGARRLVVAAARPPAPSSPPSACGPSASARRSPPACPGRNPWTHRIWPWP